MALTCTLYTAICLPVEGEVESVKVVSLGGFFLGSSLYSWSWSLVDSPEVVIKNTAIDHSIGLGVLLSSVVTAINLSVLLNVM